MSPISNPKVIFNSVPKAFPIPGETIIYDESDKIDLEAPELKDGEALVKILTLSCDPYMRGRMRDASIKSYVPAFELQKPLQNFGVAEVLKSNNSRYDIGQKLYGYFDFQAYSVISAPTSSDPQYRVVENSENLPWSAWVGVAGMPGKTAFYGLKALSKSKKGERIFVSSAYGPVGQLVCQIAKKDGLEVIGSAGTDKKVEWLQKELGITAFNYKTQNTAEELKKFGPIDVYWDNVGGETLDAAFGAMSNGGRAIECGMISGYNSQSAHAFKNIMHIIAKGLTVSGFIVHQYESEYAKEFYETIPKALSSGEFKFQEDVYDGLKNAPQALVNIFEGKNNGKVAIKVADA